MSDLVTRAEQLWKSIEQIPEPNVYPRDVELFRQGCSGGEVYLCWQGVVKLSRVTVAGSDTVTGWRSKGAILGSDAVILERPYSASAITLVNSHLSRLCATQFRDLVRNNNEFSWLLHCIESAEERALGETIESHRSPAYQRLVWLLSHCIDRSVPLAKGPIRLALRLKQVDIAQAISVTPEYLSRMFQRLEMRGVLLRDNGWLLICDPRELMAEADSSHQPGRSLAL